MKIWDDYNETSPMKMETYYQFNVRYELCSNVLYSEVNNYILLFIWKWVRVRVWSGSKFKLLNSSFSSCWSSKSPASKHAELVSQLRIKFWWTGQTGANRGSSRYAQYRCGRNSLTCPIPQHQIEQRFKHENVWSLPLLTPFLNM